jgi:hypothetical protein
MGRSFLSSSFAALGLLFLAVAHALKKGGTLSRMAHLEE